MKPLAKPDQYYEQASAGEKSPGRDDEWSSPTHTRACNGRLRQTLFPALIAIVALSGLVALFCLLCGHMAMAEPGEIIETILLAKRSSESDSKKTSFTRNKLYLIIIFVGLFLVIILGFFLVWCYRSRSKRGAVPAAIGGGFAAAG
ncbi:hypothetical protein B0H13DRAFT_2348363 [Mycena leptocephala]|nr:hypothetical protein B0H13DRAFT_2348363 [Mycena leptocephala]